MKIIFTKKSWLKRTIILKYCPRHVTVRFLERIDSYPTHLLYNLRMRAFQPLSVMKILPKRIHLILTETECLSDTKI